MDSSVLLTNVVAAAIGFFLFFKVYRSHQENKEPDSSSSSSSSSSSVPSSSNNLMIYDVFPSFRGEDVRKNVFSHIQKEFQRKGIRYFIDNDIKRGESIHPELISAIRGSKISIVLLSKNYTSSKWCLDELVQIIKCKEEFDQTVLPIFYDVEPADVKKLTGDFGKVFRKTCAGRSKEETERWRLALENVATTGGYHSINWDNDAAMIEKIATDVSTELLNYGSSSVLDGYVGMRSHMAKMDQLLSCLDSNEVRMIGIWGPSGIGKSTIARALFEKHSHKFQCSVFMENIRRRYPIPCHDVYSAQLQLQAEMLSQIINQQEIKIRHLDVAKDRLKDKRVLVVLDDVDHVMQLDALAKEARWFGPGSRIIMTTQDKRVLHRHGINHIHEVGFPSDVKALKIFCMYAFGQKSPYDGFESLARKVTQLAGNLPLGLMLMGSYFRGMSRREWEMELPRLWTSLNGEIESVLKFSYDALCDEDKELFIYIACFFNNEWIGRMEEFLAERFCNVRYGLHVLADKSLISIDRGWIRMHNLLAHLGREIVRKQSIHGPGQRQFLVDGRETCQILSNSYTLGSINVIGIDCEYSEIEGGLYKNDKAFEKVSNLQFLRIGDTHPRVHLPQSLKCLPQTLRLLDWDGYPMTCLPSNFNPEFLVEIYMPSSNLEKLWEGSQTITNLKRMYLRDSENLKEVPDLSTAISLWKLDLSGCSSLVELSSSIGNAINLNELFLSRCSSLVELPSSIGNATKLKRLNLSDCSRLVELPFSIGNATNLTELDLRGCTSLVELPSSIGNLHKLSSFILKGCSKIEAIPVNINMKSLRILDLADCSLLKTFPEICANIQSLMINGTAIEEIPSSVTLWSHLYQFAVSYCENLGSSTHAFDLITEMHVCDQGIQELAPWIKEMSCLRKLIISGCTKLVLLMELPGSLQTLEAKNCESLKRLDSSFPNKNLHKLDLSGCSSLVELPSSIGNATNLREMKLSKCSSLVELPSSIGNLQKLQRLNLKSCTKLESLPTNINMESLREVDLADCSSLKTFPKISTNIERLKLKGTAIEDIPSSITSTWSHLHHLAMPYSENLGKSRNAFDLITVICLCDKRIRELSPWIKELRRLRKLVISGCTKLVSLPQLPHSLRCLKAENCESLERLDSFEGVVSANFGNCLKLNEEARELIIRSCRFAVLPGERMPMYFLWQANGSSLSTKWNGTEPIVSPLMMGVKACVLVVNKGDDNERKEELDVYYCIKDGTSTSVRRNRSGIGLQRFPVLEEHLYTFEMEEKVSCRESVFEFEVGDKNWEVRGCGLTLVSSDQPTVRR